MKNLIAWLLTASALLLVAPDIAFAACPATLTSCPSPSYNTVTANGVTTGSLTSSGTVSGAAGNFSGALTPSGGIVGSSTGSPPASGYIGQPQVVTGSSTNLVASTVTNLASVSLSPGIYTCSANVNLGTLSSAATNIQEFLTNVSASISGIIYPSYFSLNMTSAIFTTGSVEPTISAPIYVTSTETIWLDGFSSSATTGTVGHLVCVRSA